MKAKRLLLAIIIVVVFITQPIGLINNINKSSDIPTNKENIEHYNTLTNPTHYMSNLENIKNTGSYNFFATKISENRYGTIYGLMTEKKEAKYRTIEVLGKDGKQFVLLYFGDKGVYIDPHLYNETFLEENEYIIGGKIPVIFITEDFNSADNLVEKLKLIGIIEIKTNNFLPFIYALIPLNLIESIPTLTAEYGTIGIYLNEKLKIELSDSVDLIKNETIWSNIENQYGTKINGSGVLVAVLDTGIDKTHPDIDDLDDDPTTADPKVIAEKSFVDHDWDGTPDESPSDGYGHGTHVASIIAGTGNASNYTYVGVAPGALLLNGKVLSDEGWGYTSWIIDGITWAVNSSADVINMSLGGYGDRNDPLSMAVKWAVEQNVVVVVAAGNNYLYGSIASPGVADYAITVGAVSKTLGLAEFSSKGPVEKCIIKPDVVAPGVDIIAARATNTTMGEPIDDYYTKASGTSMATPHVAGVVALIKQVHPDWNSTIIKSVLMNTAVNLGYHPFEQGAGLVNASAAVLSQLATLPASISINHNLLFNDTVELKFSVTNLIDETLEVSISVNFTRFESYYNKKDPYYLSEENILSMTEFLVLEGRETDLVNIVLNISGYPDGYFNGTILLKVNGSRVYRVIFAFYKMSQILLRIYSLEGINLAEGSPNLVSFLLIYGVYTFNYTTQKGYSPHFYAKKVNDSYLIEVLGNNNYTVYAIGILVLEDEEGQYYDYAFYLEKNITLEREIKYVNLYVSDGEKYVIKAPKTNDMLIAMRLKFEIFDVDEDGTINYFRGLGYGGYDYFIGDRVFYITNVTKKYVNYYVQFSPKEQLYHTIYFVGYHYNKTYPENKTIVPKNFVKYNIFHDTPYKINKTEDGRLDSWAIWFWYPPKWYILIAPWIYTHPSEQRVFYFWGIGNWKIDYKYMLEIVEFTGIYAGDPTTLGYEILTHQPLRNMTFILGSKVHLPGNITIVDDALRLTHVMKWRYSELLRYTNKFGYLNISLYDSIGNEIWEYNGKIKGTFETGYIPDGTYRLEINGTFFNTLWNKTWFSLEFNKTSTMQVLPTIEEINSTNYYIPDSEYSFEIDFTEKPASLTVYWRVESGAWSLFDRVESLGKERYRIVLGKVDANKSIDIKIYAEFENATLEYLIEKFAYPVRTQKVVLKNDVVDVEVGVVYFNLTSIYNNTVEVMNFAIVKIISINDSLVAIYETDENGGFKYKIEANENHVGKYWLLRIISRPWFLYSGIDITFKIYVGSHPTVVVTENNIYFSEVIWLGGEATDLDGEVVEVYARVDGYTDWIKANGTNKWNISISTASMPQGEYTVTIKAIDEHELIGNITVDIIIDKASPSVDIYVYEEIINVSWVVLTWVGYDVYGIKYYEVSVDNTTWINVGLNTSYNFTGLPEGERVLYVKAYDVAGNSNFDSVTITVDLSPPILEIITPENNSFTNSTDLEVVWNCSDEHSDIHYILIKIDEQPWIKLRTATNFTFHYLSEEKHIIYLKAYDYAGNSVEKKIIVYVDLTPPTIIVTTPKNHTVIGEREVNIEFDYLDNYEVDHIDVRVNNGSWVSIGLAKSYEARNLFEGENVIEIKAIDKVGNTMMVRLVIYVDVVPPEIILLDPENNTVVSETSVEIEFYCTDNFVLDHIEVKVNDGPWIDIGVAQSYLAEDLNEGVNVIYIKAVDKVGNTSVIKVIIIVKKSTPWTPYLIAGVVVAIILVAIATILIRRR